MGVFLVIALIVCGIFALKKPWKKGIIASKQSNKSRIPISNPLFFYRAVQPLTTNWPSGQDIQLTSDENDAALLESVEKEEFLLPQNQRFMDFCISTIKGKGFWSITTKPRNNTLDTIILFAYRNGGKRYRILCKRNKNSVSFKMSFMIEEHQPSILLKGGHIISLTEAVFPMPKEERLMGFCIRVVKESGFQGIKAEGQKGQIVVYANMNKETEYKIVCRENNGFVLFNITSYREFQEKIKKQPHPPSTHLQSMSHMSGTEFEEYCKSWLRNGGFANIRGTPGSGDQGVDITATKDGKRYAFQCKYYKYAVGNKAVQEVNSGKSYYHCDVAVVLTNSTFTKSAQELARATGVLLWQVT